MIHQASAIKSSVSSILARQTSFELCARQRSMTFWNDWIDFKQSLIMEHRSWKNILLTWSWWALVFRYSKSFRRFAKALTLISKMVKNKTPDFIFILFFNFLSLTLCLILGDRKTILLYKSTEFFFRIGQCGSIVANVTFILRGMRLWKK